MPDPRPLSSLRPGTYDEPPASSESSTPQTRRSRLRRAIQDTNALARDTMAARTDLNHVASALRPRSYAGPIIGRRQRSESAHEEERLMTPTSVMDESRRHRPKRRRIDPSPPPQRKQGIKYGYYGQVEPGRLKMELISCDGGEHRDLRHPTTSLGPENLLRHDKSVYCSERPYCDIILRHVDDTPFCMEKLHIVGPEHGFTAPVRSGLVYVAMTMNDLQKYVDPPAHARLQGVHSPPYRRRRERSIRASPERISLEDALRDPEVTAALDHRERDYDIGSELTLNEGYYGNDFGFGRNDPEAHCEIPAYSDNTDVMSTYTGGARRPVTLLSDEEPGPEESSSQEVLDYRLQRLRMMRRRFELETRDRDERWAGLNRLPPDNTDRDRENGMWGLNRLDALMARSRVHDSATPELDSPPELSHLQAHSRVIADGHDDKNVTCARFSIKRGKYKVAIKFDPPVSGRFILLKAWANRSNVDVQSVIAKGYGGCRFFPAKSVR